MEYVANIRLTEAYFKESFEQWLNHKSKFRRWQIHIGVLILNIGAGMTLYKSSITSVWISIIGVIEIVEFFFYRHRWIQKRLDARSRNRDSSVILRAGESGMYLNGPTSEGTVSWDGVKAAVPTAKGLFISVGDGMSMYVPDACMNSPEFKAFVMKKIAGGS